MLRVNSTSRSITWPLPLLFTLSFFLFACEQQTAGEALPTATVHFVDSNGKSSYPITAEIARSNGDRQKGLMYRKSLDAGYGMLFVFPGDDRRIDMWMKNTYIPLDMIFINKNLKVVGIIRDIPILNLKRRGVEADAKYVLEVGAGETERLGIAMGSQLVVAGGITDAVD